MCGPRRWELTAHVPRAHRQHEFHASILIIDKFTKKNNGQCWNLTHRFIIFDLLLQREAEKETLSFLSPSASAAGVREADR